jgi:hypothetical protein
MQKNFYFGNYPKFDINQYICKNPVYEWKLDDKTLDSIQIKMLIAENEYYKNKCEKYESEIIKMKNTIDKYEKNVYKYCVNLSFPTLD